MRQVPFGGWNCTIPNKVKMYEFCDHRAESAEQFRAVNTVVNEDGVLTGHNTDGVGWSRALRDAFGRGPDELRILLLGTGGAGRAIATQAILEKCPELIVANRDPKRARELLAHLNAQFSTGPAGPHAAESPRRRLGRTGARSRAARSRSRRQRHLGRARPEGARDPSRADVARQSAGLDTVYGAGCAKLRQEVETAGREVERRPGDAAPPGRGGLDALDGTGRALGNHAAGAESSLRRSHRLRAEFAELFRSIHDRAQIAVLA